MRMLTTALTTLHADRAAHGPGRAPSLAECLDAARAGCLYDLDTQSAGYDGLAIGDDDDVIAEWASACGVESPRGWAAERITLVDLGEPRIALRNDQSRPTYVHEMTDEQVAACHRHAALMDDEIRNALDGASDDGRAWLALYASRHEAVHGTPWCLP